MFSLNDVRAPRLLRLSDQMDHIYRVILAKLVGQSVSLANNKAQRAHPNCLFDFQAADYVCAAKGQYFQYKLTLISAIQATVAPLTRIHSTIISRIAPSNFR